MTSPRERAPTRRSARHPRSCLAVHAPPGVGHSAPGIWGVGSLIEGLLMIMGGPAPILAGPYPSAGGDADAGLTRRGSGRSLPREVSGQRAGAPPYCPAQPGPVRRRSGCCCHGQRPADGQELIPRLAGPSGLSGGGRRGVWAFTRRPSVAVRRRRSGSILALSVVPRRRKAAHTCVRIAILATAARCRRGRRWPAACHRG